MSILPSFFAEAANPAGVSQDTPKPAALKTEAAAQEAQSATAESANENLFVLSDKNMSSASWRRMAASGYHDGVVPGLFSQFSEAAKDDKKEKETRDFLLRMTAQQMQEKIRKELDNMRNDLAKEIDKRLGDLQKQLAQMQVDNQRLHDIQDRLKASYVWPLDKDDTRFLREKAGEERFEAIKRDHKAREEAAATADKNPTPENIKKRETADQNFNNTINAVTQAEDQKEQNIQTKIERLKELQEIVDKPEGQQDSFAVKDGEFIDKLLQRAAEKAGIDPATYDPNNQDQADKLYDNLDKIYTELKKEIQADSAPLKETMTIKETAPIIAQNPTPLQ